MSRYLGVPARVLLLLFGLSVVPALARADYIYTVTNTFLFSTQFSFTQPTLASFGTVTSLTQISGFTTIEFAWHSAASGNCFGGFFSFACAGINFGPPIFGGIVSPFPVGSFLAPGTYTSLDGFLTVNITSTGVPEPSSLLLLGSGILGLLGAARRKLKA